MSSAGRGLQQQILIRGRVWIVALEAIANRRAVNRSFDLFEILVRVAGDTEGLRRGFEQNYSSNVLAGSDFMTASASCRYCGVNKLSLGLVLMTLNAFRWICILVEWYGVCRGAEHRTAQHEHETADIPQVLHDCNSKREQTTNALT